MTVIVTPLSVAERQARFDELTQKIPNSPEGSRVKFIMAACLVAENTARIWACSSEERVIPQSKLVMLENAMKQQGIPIS